VAANADVSKTFSPGQKAKALAFGDISHTLRWMGVKIVERRDKNGNPLPIPEGFRIKLIGQTSGFDYFNAAPIPELRLDLKLLPPAQFGEIRRLRFEVPLHPAILALESADATGSTWQTETPLEHFENGRRFLELPMPTNSPARIYRLRQPTDN
jgi:hypothetical protein